MIARASRLSPRVARALAAGVVLVLACLALAIGKPGRADPAASPRPVIHGVNLPTGGFAPERLPGVHGTDYLFPRRETGAPFLAMGMNAARVAFVWERLQPRPLGAL